MKKLTFTFALLIFSACAFAQSTNLTGTDKAVFQQGLDKDATWGYIGFLPRMQDPKRIKIFASKKGLTMRVHIELNRAEIENYARFLVSRADQMEEVRNGEINITQPDGTYSTPFDVVEKKAYDRYRTTIQDVVEPVVNGGLEANLNLLKNFYNANVTSSDGEQVIFDMVFPISMQKTSWTNFAWVNAEPHAGIYNIHTVENRRTFHSPDSSYVFAGFPALWFNGGIGFHGPIASTKNSTMITGADLLEEYRPEEPATKRWQLLRAPVSAGCMRMEHINELRNMLPSDDKDAMKVQINILNDYDSVKGQTVGVKYYWYDVTKIANENDWKKIFYAGKIPSNLFEYPYYEPQIVQVKPLRGSNNAFNPNATANNLIRLPLTNI